MSQPETETPVAVTAPEALEALQGGCTGIAVRRVARVMTQIFDEAMASSGLTVGQFGLLGCILHRPGATLQHLGRMSDMDQSTVTRALKPLERDGLVTIETAPDDRRSRLVRPTPEGIARFEAASRLWKMAQATINDRLGEDVRVDLTGRLNATARKLRAKG